jgi:hypothetical protein
MDSKAMRAPTVLSLRLTLALGLFCAAAAPAGCNRPGSSSAGIMQDDAEGQGELLSNGTRLMQITVSREQVGTSPKTIGIGIHSYDTKLGNQPLYLKALGVNGTRHFAGYLKQTLQEFVGPRWGQDLTGKPVGTQKELSAAMNSLSSDPEGAGWQNPIKWDQVRQHIDETGTVDLLKTQSRFGVATHLQLSRPKQFDFATYDRQQPAYWEERWELYKYYYAYGRVIMQAGGTSFEVQNEPDKWAHTRILETMQLVGTAIQRAAADLQKKDIIVMGPTMATSVAMATSVRGTIFPELLAQMHTPLAATSEQPGWSNLTALALHRYSGSGRQFVGMADSFNKLTRASLGARLPLYFTEYQAHTGRSWSALDTTSDQPAEASRFAAETTALLSRTEGMYAFVLGAYPSKDGNAAKNGIHYVSTGKATPQLLGGRTRAALTYSLIAKHFANSRPLFRACVRSVCDQGVVSMTQDTKHWHILVVNDTPQESQVKLDLKALTLNPETHASVELVSLRSRGGVAERLKVGQNQAIGYRQPPHSTALITVPRGIHPVMSASLSPTLAVNLRSGEQGDGAGMAAAEATVMTASGGSQATTQAYAMLFTPQQSLPSVLNKKVVDAFLKVTSIHSGSAPSVVHVYGVPTPQWSAGQLTWNNSGILMPLAAGAKVESIADNFVKTRGVTDLELLGDIAVPANTPVAHHLLRISDFTKRNWEGFGVVIVREFRTDRYEGSLPYNPRADSLHESSVVFGGTDAAKENRPELLVDAK